MEDYQVILPSTPLSTYVKHYWFLKTSSINPAEIRTVPTGHVCLMFHRGKQIFSTSEGNWQPQAFLSGHESGYTDLLYFGQVNMICVVFRPFGAKAFFRFPIDDLKGIRVSVNDLNDKKLIDLQNILIDTQDHHHCITLIEKYLYECFQPMAEYNLKRIKAAIQLIHSGTTDVRMLADEACLSYKQFKRIFTGCVGTNPKEFLCTIRFQKALYILENQPHINLAQLALACGCYDQSHLINEFNFFSGYTPVEYLSVCNPHSDYFSQS